MIDGRDQLRQRTVFALSQMWVVSDLNFGDQPMTMGYYLDQIGKNAFGNYRDLMEDITYSPAMGGYLTYQGNTKGDPETGRTPDENYARELLQLFTTGLVELNMDGTPKLVGGEPVEVYDNDDVIGLARVFTGLDLKNREDYQYDPHGSRRSSRMVIYPDRHSPLEKSFLGTTIPAGYGCGGKYRPSAGYDLRAPQCSAFRGAGIDPALHGICARARICGTRGAGFRKWPLHRTQWRGVRHRRSWGHEGDDCRHPLG